MTRRDYLIISPILANIYLHYVLDLWLEKRFRKELEGRMLWMRFADDFIVCFERKRDAENFLAQLGPRLKKFSLDISRGKERAGEVQPVGAGQQREVHLPGFRLLLGAHAPEPQPQDGQTQNEQEEASRGVGRDEGLDSDQYAHALGLERGTASGQTDGSLELLRRTGKQPASGHV